MPYCLGFNLWYNAEIMSKLKLLLRTLSQVETVFMILSLVALISTAVIQSSADKNITQMHKSIDILKNVVITEAISCSDTSDIKSISTDTKNTINSTLKGLKVLCSYDVSVIEVVNTISNSIPAVSSFPEYVKLLDDVEALSDRIYTLEGKLRYGYQVLSSLCSILLLLSIVLAVKKHFDNERRFVHWVKHREIAQKRISIQEEERVRIARELHDGIAQDLARTKLIMQKGSSDVIEEALLAIDDSIKSVRWLCSSLRNGFDYSNVLEYVCEETICNFKQQYFIPISVVIATSKKTRWKQEQCYEINRILQEGLTNVAKHSHASSVSLHIVEVGFSLRIVLEDNGVGLSGLAGFGMRGIRERCELLNGEVLWETPTTGGTRLIVTIPLPTEINEEINNDNTTG